MSQRSLSRHVALQTLYEWDFNGKHLDSVSTRISSNADHLEAKIFSTTFAEELVSGVLQKNDALDEIIEKAAPEWPLDKIAAIDRNVIRIGLFELLFGDANQVPPKVAINEAVELAKLFGGESSGKFVNGVLGSVYRELGEPGKDQETQKKSKEIPVDKKVGALVYSIEGGSVYVVLVHDVFGYWTLPKGSVSEGQTPEESLPGVIFDEVHVTPLVKDQIGTNEYFAYDPQRGRVKKQVDYFVAYCEKTDLKLSDDPGGVDQASWFSLGEVSELHLYNDIMPLIAKATSIIAQE